MFKCEILKTTEGCISSRMFLVNLGKKGADIKVISFPTENCQTFMIAPFYRLVTNIPKVAELAQAIVAVRDLCSITTKLCSIDVSQDIFNKIEKHVNVHAKMEYVNLTGSRMVQCLLKI